MESSKPMDGAISKRKLGDLVEEQLLALLQGGTLAPGDVLPSERELMEQFKVGRPAIREAMQSLQRKGLIEIRHGERPRVARPSFDRTLLELAETVRHLLLHSEGSMDHLKEARLMFETAMARRAAERATATDVAAITDALARQKTRKPGSEDFMRSDGEFHSAIAQVSGNPILTALSGCLFNWLSEFHAEEVRKPGLENLTISEHTAILDAIRNADADEASRQMINHLTRANALYRVDPPKAD